MNLNHTESLMGIGGKDAVKYYVVMLESEVKKLKGVRFEFASKDEIKSLELVTD